MLKIGTLNKKVLPTLVIFSLSLYFAKNCYAARSLAISLDKDSLFGEEELIITTVPTGFSEGETIYIKGAFFQDGTSNYFGYTKNADSWVKNGASSTAQRQVKIGDWDTKLIVKSDFLDSGYKGEGGYKLKVGFYYTTASGSMSAVNWSANVLDVNISEPDPTPIPTPTSSPKTAAVSAQTSAKSPTPMPKLSPTPTVKSQIFSPSVLGKSSTQSASLLMSSNKQDAMSPKPSPEEEPAYSKIKIAIILSAVGAFLIGSSAMFYFWYYRVRGRSKLQVENPSANHPF